MTQEFINRVLAGERIIPFAAVDQPLVDHLCELIRKYQLTLEKTVKHFHMEKERVRKSMLALDEDKLRKLLETYGQAKYDNGYEKCEHEDDHYYEPAPNNSAYDAEEALVNYVKELVRKNYENT